MAIRTPAGEVFSIIATLPNRSGGIPVKQVLTAEGQIWPPVGRSRIEEYWQPPASNFPELGGHRTDLLIGPWWATFADVVVCGAGGGGAGGDGAVGRDGNGGRAGQWAHGTLTPEPAAPYGLPQISVLGVTLAALGGTGGAKERSGVAGTGTGVSGTGVSGTGGAGGSGYGDATGASPGNYTAFGRTFTGGTGGTRGNPGTAPGGGGGGGKGGTFGSADGGAAGGGGYIWVRWRSD